MSKKLQLDATRIGGQMLEYVTQYLRESSAPKSMPEGFDFAIKQLQESEWRDFVKGDATSRVIGYYHRGADATGPFSASLFDETGAFLEATCGYEDPQLEGDSPSPINVQDAPESPTPLSGVSVSELARDVDASPVDRQAALFEWISKDILEASEYVLGQLLVWNELPHEWRNAIVYGAEDIEIDVQEKRRQAAGCLYEVAVELRESQSPEDEPVAFSAIRRFATLIEASEVGRLREFVTPSGGVDTYLVALQSIVVVAECEPAGSLLSAEGVPELVNRVLEIARKNLDPDVFAAGGRSAIAGQAVCALAALGESRVMELVPAVRELDKVGHGWFAGRLRADLLQLDSIGSKVGEESDSISNTFVAAIGEGISNT